MPKTANKISFLVDQQLPDFINEEYELFGKFIQKYYEQSELQGQPLDIVENLQNYRDIDFYENNLLNQSTTVSGLVNISDTTITVADATSFPKSGYFKIDDEICFYKSRTDTQFKEISRGVSGNTTLGDLYNKTTFVTTQASSHTNGSKVLNISNLFLYALIKNFEQEYLTDFPEEYLNDAVDKRTLIKNISSFYQSKGTDKSIKFLFKCLVKDDPEPEVAYPRDFTLKSSESNWINNYSLKVRVLSGTVTDLIGKTITQNISSGKYASAVVDNVRYNGKYGTEELYEIILNEASVNGEFSIASKTKLTKSIAANDTVGDRIDVESTMGWSKKGEFTIGSETVTFEDKNVNQFIIKTRSGNSVHTIGTPVTYGANVSGAGVTLLVYGVFYNATNKTEAPYSNPGDVLEISEPGFTTSDIRLFDAQNNLRWIQTTGSVQVPALSDLNTNVAAIYEDGEGYYIASSGWPSHAVAANPPATVSDQKHLKILRKQPISTTEIYETKYRDVGIAVNGIPFAGYKDEDVIIDGPIQKITVNTKGINYKDDPFVLVGGVANRATATRSGETVESITVTNAGDYTAVPTVEIVSGRNGTGTAVVTNGVVTSITINDAGEYYSTPPVVRILDAAGKGRFAEYTTTVNTAGAITSFNKINGGNYYSQENISVQVITVGSGASATATVKEWRKDKYYKNKNSLDAENGYWLQNFDSTKGYGYAYYASPTTLRVNDTGTNHSPILGFAYDGNPIYGAYGYTDPLDSTSTVTQMTSSYLGNTTRPNGPSTVTYPVGTFIQDWVFTDGAGTLDQNNGRFCVTPEYPDGTYAYFITVDSSGDPRFPYILGKNYYSLPLDSNYNSKISQDDLPVDANRLRTGGISRNGVKTVAKVKDVKRGTVSSATILNSGTNFSVGGKLVIDNSGTDGSDAAGEIESVKGRTVTSIQSQSIKALYIEISNTAYLFNGDTITQANTGATGTIVGDVFTAKKFALSSVTGTFNSTDVLSSNTKVINLILDQKSSYSKSATLSFSDGVNNPVATGTVLETTNAQNSVKVKVLTGNFTVSPTLFLTSSDLVNTTGSKIVSFSSLSENLIPFKVQDNIAILTTSDAHNVAIGEKVNVDVNPSDASSTTTYFVRKRVYQEAVLKNPVISTTLSDTGVGRVAILNGGGDYTAGTYTDIALSGGSGSDAKATIVVSSAGLVNSVTITDKGKDYKQFDVLSVSGTALSKSGGSTKPDLQLSVDHVGFSIQNTVLNVANTDKITVSDKLQIGNEIVTVLSKSGTALTVRRAEESTTALDHFNGATVSVYNFGYSLPVDHAVGNTSKDAKVVSYDSTTQKAVFAWDYDQSVTTINKIDLNTVFYDNSSDKKLVEIVSFTTPDTYFEFSSDGTTFIRNQIIDIKEYYKYKFDTTHTSMSGVGFDISPSKNFNIATPERTIQVSNQWVDLKLGFGSRISTNTYSTKKEVSYKKYYYYDRDGIVNSEISYFNVIKDPLQGEKVALYVTPTKIVYSTDTKASHDGTGTITYTSKSLFSVGAINTLKITNIGKDYKKIPIVTGIYDKDGKIDKTVSAYLNSVDIGIPSNIQIENNGGGYHNDQTLKSSFRSNYIFKLSGFVSDSYDIGETIVQRSGATEIARARVTSWRKGSNILIVDKVTGIFREKQQILGLAKGKTSTLDSITYNEFNPIIKTYFDNIGKYQSDYGKVGDANQKISDSYYYQDFSYLVKSKTPIDTWRSLIKETTHPAGFQLFGEVLVESKSQIPMSSNTKTTHNSFIELKSNITVQSTTKQITQYIVSAQTHAIEEGVGSVSLDSANTTEVKAGNVKLTPAFDGALSNKGNLAGTKTFNIVDDNNNSVTPYNNQALLITLDGIFQEPGVAYTISGSQITFAQPPLGPTTKNGQEVPGVKFYGKNYQFKTNTLNSRYFKKIRNIYQRTGRWVDAANQLERNREYIQSETLGWTKNKYPTLTWGTIETKCYRDIGFVVDALAHDIRFGGNQSTVEAIQKYFNNDILDYIQGEQEETLEAYEYAVELAKKAMKNALPTGTYTTVAPYANINILADSSPKCADVESALTTLAGVIRSVFNGGVGSVPISYPDYIDGKNKVFELYYEDGVGVATEPNENLIIAISGIIQHDSSYSIDRTSVPNKVVFTSPPLWGQAENTKTLGEPLAVDKFFAYGIGNYHRCEINKSDIPTGSTGPFLMLKTSDKEIISIDDSRLALVFIDGVLQREESYIINGPSITFDNKVYPKNNIEIIYLYGRDLDQSITLHDYERNEYYNEIKVKFDGTSGAFNAFEGWWGKFNEEDMIAYQKSGSVKNIIGSLKSYSIDSSNDLTVQISGRNPDTSSGKVYFSGLKDFSDEIELDLSFTVTVTADADGDYKMQRNASRWLYGRKKADEAFYVKKGLANLSKGDLIKISGEDEYRTIKELPRYLTPKTYVPGEDPSQSFFGTVATTNYNGEERGLGLSVTCTISGGKVDTITWDKNVAIKGYEKAPILHFVPLDQTGGGARAEVIVVDGTVVDIILTDPGSGYTKAPKIIVAKQYLIKKQSRKVDSFFNLIFHNQFSSIAQPGPVNAESSYSLTKGVGGTPPGAAIVTGVTSTLNLPAVVDKFTIIFDAIGIDVASTFATTKEILYIRAPSTGTADVKATDAVVKVHLELNRSIESQPTHVVEIGKETTYQIGFTDHRFWSTVPTGFANITLRPTFQMWEGAKFMDTGNILHNGVSVSALTIEEFNRWGFDLADFANWGGSGISDAGYAFNVGYPSINYYMGRINQNLVAGDLIVYAASTSDFPATGTLQLGSEQITYTGKLSDRFTGCTRGANGTVAQAHTAGDYFRSA